MIFRDLLSKELRQYRWVFGMGLGLALLNVFLVVLSYDLLGGIIKEVSIDIWEKFQIKNAAYGTFNEFSYYLWSQWNAKNLYQLGVIIAAVLAVAQFSGESSKRNMSFLLSQPATRRQIFAGKSGAGLAIIYLIFALSTLCLCTFSLLLGHQVLWTKLLVSSLIGLLWLTVFYLLGCVFSIINPLPFLAGLALLGVGVILAIPGWFFPTRRISIFYQMKAVGYFLKGDLWIISVLPALLLSGLLYYYAQQLFERKDY